MFADMARVLEQLEQAKGSGRKMLGVLIDPDQGEAASMLERTVQNACMAKADILLVGGSLLTSDRFDAVVAQVKRLSDRPVVLFPGSATQVSGHADALLFLSLISGRNADLLIGQHVVAAPAIRSLGLETIPTGYLLVDGGRPTTASYISQTHPIPHDKPAIAAPTALAGELLGLRCMYLDTGSGAQRTVDPSMVMAVRKAVKVPLIVGGGIRTRDQVQALCEAGADMLVVGTAFEQDPELIFALSEAVHR
jgi:putative glycerol-1-phosphate prenyltransferase